MKRFVCAGGQSGWKLTREKRCGYAYGSVPQRAVGDAKEIRGMLWPHGKATLSWIRKESADDRVLLDPPDSVRNGGFFLTDKTRETIDEIASSANHQGDGRGEPLPCQASKIPKNEKNESRSPSRGLSRFGSNMVRSGAVLIEGEFPPSRCTFATLTLPELTQAEREKVTKAWGRLCSRLLDWLRGRLQRKSIKPWVVGVTEIQAKRLERSGQCYLHLHVVWGNPPRRVGWAVDTRELKAWWTKKISAIAGRDVGECRIETAIVRKSVSSYLGKYLTKGFMGSPDGDRDSSVVNELPRQWWIMSSQLRSSVKRACRKGRACGQLLQKIREEVLTGKWPKGLVWLSDNHIEWGDIELYVGTSFIFNKTLTRKLSLILNSA